MVHARPDAAERHSIVIDAPPERVWAALKSFSARDLKIVKPLFVLRGLAALVRHGHLQRDLPAAFVPLTEIPGKELTSGIVGQWWKLGAARNVAIADAAAFEAFAEPGYAKGVFGFTLEAHAGRTKLTTETTVTATSPDARRAFLRYWRVIRPGSGLIRVMMLRRVKAIASGRA
ncbi:MAG: hypothetical protein HOV86_17710 [Thermoactinospora sp.]|nr:hypothetical protein [Thermoactinospora sp.]